MLAEVGLNPPQKCGDAPQPLRKTTCPSTAGDRRAAIEAVKICNRTYQVLSIAGTEVANSYISSPQEDDVRH